ncbi:hypothetical protein PHMEG_00024016 [Phytophthora megakarya]|uniref:Uncharacterized protein n=1 Tax=Phytophthora megakarya TaxID=4795 RepID=A0A225VFG6_9STRA|nr:hypothetical protein PHMEG_00024016 [Phytophthora megakarya]
MLIRICDQIFRNQYGRIYIKSSALLYPSDFYWSHLGLSGGGVCSMFVKQSKKAGCANLVNHLAVHHPSYEYVLRTCFLEKRAVTMDMFVDRHVVTHEWMKLVVRKTLRFKT